MFNDPQVCLVGYLAQEPRFKTVTGDISFAKLRIAYTTRRQNRDTGEWSDGATTFVNVQCWRKLADNVNICLRKGEPVLVMGRLRIRHYEDTEGKSRTAVEIEASSVGHDLNRGVAHFFRASRAAGRTAAEAAAASEAVSGDVAEPGELTAAAAGGDGVAGGGGVAGGDGVVDERAVAEFASELSALGPDRVEDDENAAGADTETEPVPSAQS